MQGKWIVALVGIMAAIMGSSVHAETDAPPKLPRLLYRDAAELSTLRDRLKQNDPEAVKEAAGMLRDADKALKAKPLTLTEKEFVAASGDKRDYVSAAPYFWADPAKPDGLPYIRKDGERNPEISRYTDHKKMLATSETVSDLALGYYLTEREEYAAHAAKLLRVWFLDETTRMNPNLQHAQLIPGRVTGRGIGLIETPGFVRIVDALRLLAPSKSWPKEEREAVDKWLTAFLDWMQTSKNGKDEAGEKNNHGSWYDVQVVTLLLYRGRDDEAKAVVEAAKTKRIALQIEPDGSQPLEIARVTGWQYCNFNLRALTTLASLGEKADVDLWSFSTEDGRGIRKAIDWMIPYADGSKKWEKDRLGKFKAEMFAPVAQAAARKYGDEKYKALAAKLGTGEKDGH